MKKPAPELTLEDFKKYPIWKFTNEDTPDETIVAPVRRYPVKKLDGCLIGTELFFNNGSAHFGILSNIDLQSSYKTSHFVQLSIFVRTNTQVHLARYHDPHFNRMGPKQLADEFSLPLTDVFPIRYDISALAEGPRDILVAAYPADRSDKLSRSEIIQLAVRRVV